MLLKSGDSRAKKPSLRKHSPLLAARAYANSPLDVPAYVRMKFSGTTGVNLALVMTNPGVSGRTIRKYVRRNVKLDIIEGGGYLGCLVVLVVFVVLVILAIAAWRFVSRSLQ